MGAENVTEEQMSVMIPSDLKLELDTFVFRQRMAEVPNRKTTLKGTVAKAITEFLSRNTNEKR